MLSVLDVPLSLAAVRSGAPGATGGVVSRMKLNGRRVGDVGDAVAEVRQRQAAQRGEVPPGARSR